MHLWKYFLSGMMFICVSVGGMHGVFACDAGEYDNNGNCETCPGGYSCDGTNAPQQCMGDTPYSNSTYTQCVACDGLTDYHNNNNVCQTCESGFANAEHDGCVSCPAGNYMLNGQCETCPAGSYCDGDGTAKLCNGGTISESGATSISECTICPGYEPYANSTHTQCVMCDGLTEVHDANNVCQECGTGTFANLNHDGCIVCNAGNYVDNGVCTECPAGSYCPGNGRAELCSAGTCSDQGKSSCKSCMAGYYCPDSGMGGTIINNFCKPDNNYKCPVAKFSNEGASSCTDCPSGTTTDGDGKTNINDCMLPPIKLLFGDNIIETLPNCLKIGKINTRVVKNEQ